MYIYIGELYLEKSHIKLLKKEPEYVKQIENYTNLKEILFDKKEELINKYNLYDGDLEFY